MTAKVVEWVLVVRYGSSAHRATYGRLPGTTYTKDYIQLSRAPDFIRDLKAAFPALAMPASSVSVTYKWPAGSAEGTLFSRSADRPHLAWETRRGAPDPWKMLKDPTETSAQTIRGDPSHRDAASADREFNKLMSSGFGQPFLIAVKLRDEAATLHLRVLVENPERRFAWADLKRAPVEIQELAAATSMRSALASRLFAKRDGSPELYFDPDRKVDPWTSGGDQSQRRDTAKPSLEADALPQASDLDSDVLAEGLAQSEEEISQLEQRLHSGDYEVPDSFATAKTRGSAQKVFATAVKKNYSWRCALTGIKTKKFLVASHIVPWSVDEKIRLDPSNGICLSVLIDRAFENGFLIFEDDLTVTVNWKKVGDDAELKTQLGTYHGMKLELPKAHAPKVEYLSRRRSL